MPGLRSSTPQHRDDDRAAEDDPPADEMTRPLKTSTSADNMPAAAAGSKWDEDHPHHFRHPPSWWKTYGQPAFFITLWYSTSLSLSVYNKWLFGAANLNFAFPLFTSGVHMIMQLALSSLSVAFIWRKLRPTRYPSTSDYLLRVLPCGVATGMDIGLSNSSLKTISLSFYTMVKSGAPVFVLLFAFLFKLEKPTWSLTGIILIICFGMVLMVLHQTDFDVVGFAEVQTATVMSGFRWSITQILLEKESMGMSNPFATSIFLAPVMGVCLFISSGIIEGFGAVLRSQYFATLSGTVYIISAVCFGGSLAFVMVISEFKLISVTSVVTFSVAGIFKELVTIVASAIIFGDTFTTTNLAGLAISLFGIILYNYVRITSFHQNHGHGRAPGGAGGPPLSPFERGESSASGMTVSPRGDQQYQGLLSADRFFDIDIDEEDDEPDRAIFAARSLGFGYHPVSSFLNVGEAARESEFTELDRFYPVEHVDEERGEEGAET
ncbi:Triose-phosphate Transporter [Irineochytrium annulatum]|nr:Triose-phosphate Transporter [Irineochytrium annulatum]